MKKEKTEPAKEKEDEPTRVQYVSRIVPKSYTHEEINAVLDKYFEEKKQSRSPAMVDLTDLKEFVRKEIGK